MQASSTCASHAALTATQLEQVSHVKKLCSEVHAMCADCTQQCLLVSGVKAFRLCGRLMVICKGTTRS